ncbi:hypothetical protein PP176A_3174 [Sporanaerobacter sp. PP17-6a]|nr:hypothetical protein PP176A_3174 [Sporanaerobacter sp. PP17-6a]
MLSENPSERMTRMIVAMNFTGAEELVVVMKSL